MVKLDGFKIVEPTETVFGLVVHLAEGSTEFRLVDYRINEYNNYIQNEICRFAVEQSKGESYKDAFIKELGMHAQLSKVYIENDVYDFILCMK